MATFEEINALSAETVAAYLRPAKVSGVVCPNCYSGLHENGTGITPYTNSAGLTRWKCHSCGAHYSNVDIMAQTAGKTVAEIVAEYEGKPTFPSPKARPKTAQFAEVKAEKPPKDYTQFYKFRRSDIENHGGEIRGLPIDFLRRVGAGYLQDDDGKQWLILPYNKHQFFKRQLNGNDRMFIKGKRPMYNPLNAFENSLLFVTEGEIDALSIMYAIDFNNAISVGSAENFEKLPEWIDALNLPQKPQLILIADNDAVGVKKAKLAVEEWRKAGYKATYFTFSDGAEKIDANNILCSDNGKEKLQLKLFDFINQAESEFESQERETKMAEVQKLGGSLSTVFDKLDDYSANLQKNLIKTGYPILDKMLPFIPGTYLFGALPSMGKTTFALNVAANICESGTPILYVAYEQGEVDFAFKMLARYWFMQNRHWDKAKLIPTAIQMKLNKFNETFTAEEMRRVREELKPKFDNFYVIEGRKETSQQLIERMRPYISAGVKFIVIDYLQRLPNADETKDTRTGINATLADLQLFQKSTKTVMLIISSFNRQNYKNFVSLDSFKESGNLEYDADAILGLQYKVDNEKLRSDNLEIHKLSKEQPRKIQLVCVKSRDNGKFEIDFNYYSAHEYFKECAEEEGKGRVEL